MGGRSSTKSLSGVGNRRRTSLKRLYADLKVAPPNVASLEVTDAGFRVTFKDAPVLPDRPAPSAPPPKLLPGTPFPDDDSPISVADLTLQPISLDEKN